MPVAEGENPRGEQGHAPVEEFTGEEVRQWQGRHADEGRREADGQGVDPHQRLHESHQVHVQRFTPRVGGEKHRTCAVENVACQQAVDRLVEVQAGGKAIQSGQPQRSAGQQEEKERHRPESGGQDPGRDSGKALRGVSKRAWALACHSAGTMP